MNFKKAIEAKRRAAQGRHQSHEKDLSSLSESELDAELQKAQQRLSEAKRREINATRQAAADTGTTSKALFPRRAKRPWK